MKGYFGKYRGKVENNSDPLMLGRVQVSVPAVFVDGTANWAMPCAPYAGNGVGFWAIPPNGTHVWVEFEAGDTDYPILAGCFWATGEPPASPATAQIKCLVTDGIKLTLSDTPGGGGLTLEVGSPAVSTPLKLTMDSQGIKLENGSNTVKLSSSSVSVNDGALEVM